LQLELCTCQFTAKAPTEEMFGFASKLGLRSSSYCARKAARLVPGWSFDFEVFVCVDVADPFIEVAVGALSVGVGVPLAVGGVGFV
jgi:hypothetical protein